VSLPIFESAGADSLQPCSQVELARALCWAIQEGAHVVNVSGGQFSPAGAAHPLLEDAVRECTKRRILIVAAVGNDGCECLHVPAALESVLAVGAIDSDGEPLSYSNWGGPYQLQGIVAVGTDLVGAEPGGCYVRRSGTSYATAIVSGVAALLLSLRRRNGQPPDPLYIRRLLIRSALGCQEQPASDCRRLLAGRLNIAGALNLLNRELRTMDQTIETPEIAFEHPSMPAASEVTAACSPPVTAEPEAIRSASVRPAACSCGCGGPTRLVYALGRVGYDLVSEARLDSLVQKMAGDAAGSVAERLMAFDSKRLLDHLDRHPWDAAAVEWTLTLDGTTIYALRPQGPFAAEGFKELRRFLREQLSEGVERVSMPGTISGSARLLMGQTVPVLVPELRGMFSWTTKDLVAATVGAAPAAEAAPADKDAHQKKTVRLTNFLDRVYHGLRNLGVLPHDRALNFAATNAFSIDKVYESAVKEELELESINVVRSPLCRPESDCWDVELYFFYPARQVQTVRKVYRFTVDVSDVVPVTIGPTRSWFVR
jgi:hypothetical protein